MLFCLLCSVDDLDDITFSQRCCCCCCESLLFACSVDFVKFVKFVNKCHE